MRHKRTHNASRNRCKMLIFNVSVEDFASVGMKWQLLFSRHNEVRWAGEQYRQGRRVRYRTIGSGLVVSELGFGGIPILSGGLDIMPRHFNLSHSQAVGLLQKARANGITLFDTAVAGEYGDSEVKIASAFRSVWDSVVVSTKARAYTRASMLAAIEGSLANMGVPYVHIYGIHQLSPSNANLALDQERGALRALLDAKRSGLIREIAVGTHFAELASLVSKLDCVSMVQLPFNPLEHGLLRTAREHGLTMSKIVFHKVYGAGLLPAFIRPATLLSFAFAQDPVACLIGVGTDLQLDQLLLDYEDSHRVTERSWTLPHSECNRCQKCQCPLGLNISLLLRYRAYALLGFHRWAAKGFDNNYKADCTSCGDCLPLCPREVDIPKLISGAREWFAELNKYKEETR